MSGVREQLDELRRQIEEDYRVDLAALEHLLRRFSGAPTTASAAASMPVSNGAPMGPSRVKSAEPAPPALASDGPERQSDEVDGSLRAMFAKNPPKAKGSS
jgi:hypothetical protein